VSAIDVNHKDIGGIVLVLSCRCILTYRIQMLRQLEKYRLILSSTDSFSFIYLTKEWLVCKFIFIISILSNIQNFLQLGDNFALEQ